MLSLLINLIQVVFRFQIAYLFSNNNEIQNLVADNILSLTLHVFPTLIMYSVNSILRLLGHDSFQFYMNIFLYPIMIIVISYLFCFTMKLGVMGIILGFGLGRLFFIFFMLLKIFCFVDWKKNILMKKFLKEINVVHDCEKSLLNDF